MASFRSFAAFGAELDKLQREFDRVERARITRLMGERAQAIAEQAASRDLGGDPKFSGWAPRLDTELVTKSDGSTLIGPTRSSAGPWTVAESGRNQGNARGFFGPGVNVRTGLTSRTKTGAVRKVRVRKGRRWNGYTTGKGTASDATARMERELPLIAEAGVRRVLVKHFDVT